MVKGTEDTVSVRIGQHSDILFIEIVIIEQDTFQLRDIALWVLKIECHILILLDIDQQCVVSLLHSGG